MAEPTGYQKLSAYLEGQRKVYFASLLEALRHARRRGGRRAVFTQLAVQTFVAYGVDRLGQWYCCTYSEQKGLFQSHATWAPCRPPDERACDDLAALIREEERIQASLAEEQAREAEFRPAEGKARPPIQIAFLGDLEDKPQKPRVRAERPARRPAAVADQLGFW